MNADNRRREKSAKASAIIVGTVFAMFVALVVLVAVVSCPGTP